MCLPESARLVKWSRASHEDPPSSRSAPLLPSRLRGGPVRLVDRVGGTTRRGRYACARRAIMIRPNDFERISSIDSPVASASCSVTAPHAMPRRK